MTANTHANIISSSFMGLQQYGIEPNGVSETVIYFAGNGILLLAYILIYVLFFKKQDFLKAIILGIIRVIVFALCGILLRHWFLVIFAGIFAIGHFAVIIKKYKEK